MNCAKRLNKEAQNLIQNFSNVLELSIVDESKNIWHIKFQGAQGTLYAGENFTLQFRFDDRYPFEAPEVMFIGQPPIHEHIYANGYICLSTLSKDWTPAL